MKRYTARRTGALVGASIGAVPGVLIFVSALFTNAPHQGMVDNYFIGGVVAVVGGLLGLLIGAIVGSVVVGRQKAKDREASLVSLDVSRTAQAIEAVALADGVSADTVAVRLCDELGVFRTILDEWLAGQRQVSVLTLQRLADSLDTTPAALVGVEEPPAVASEPASPKVLGTWALFFLALAVTVPVALLLQASTDTESTVAVPGLIGVAIGAAGGLVVGLVARLGWRSIIAAAVSGAAVGVIHLLTAVIAQAVWTGEDVPFYFVEDPLLDFLLWLTLTLILTLAVQFIVPAVVVVFTVRRLRRSGTEILATPAGVNASGSHQARGREVEQTPR